MNKNGDMGALRSISGCRTRISIFFKVPTENNSMLHTDMRPFFSSTFQGLFSTQFGIHVINPSIQMTFCMGWPAKKHVIQTGICH